MVEKKFLFCAKFKHGYTIRSLVEYLKLTNKNGYLYFGPKGIAYTRAGSDGKKPSIINLLGLDTSEFSYEYHSAEINERVGLNIADIRLITKAISKKEGVSLYKLMEDPKFYIEILSSNFNENPNIGTITPIEFEEEMYELPEYVRAENEPNCNIDSDEFAKCCTNLSALKCQNIQIRGYPTGVKFQAIRSGNILCNERPFGHCDGEEVDFLISNTTMKSLAKLGNLDPNGMIKIFIEKGKPIKLMVKVGSFGSLNIYLQDIKE